MFPYFKYKVEMSLKRVVLPSMQAQLPAGSGPRLGDGQGLHLAAQVVSCWSLAVSRLCRRGKLLSNLLLMHAWSQVSKRSLLCSQPPHMPRLGLLAVATSSSVVKIYSVPHPDALHATRKQDNSGETALPLLLTMLKWTCYAHVGSLYLITSNSRITEHNQPH